jgi:predicted amidohydrolase
VDTLLYCIAWVDRPGSKWFAESLPAIARASGFNIIGANWTVPEKPAWSGYGQSLIIDHTGKTLSRVKDDLAEEIIYADLPVPASCRE